MTLAPSLATGALLACAAFGLNIGVEAPHTVAAPSKQPVGAPPKPKMSTPTLSCGSKDPSGASLDIMVCAGTTGAPAGFSIQWVTAEAFANGPDGMPNTPDDNTWPGSESNDLCKASFSGNANGSTYNLAANACITITIGDTLFDEPGASSNCASTPLQCGTEYVIRAFAHANNTLMRSEFTCELRCSTAACSGGEGCTFSQGHWKTHGPVPTGNNTNEWPVTGLMLGTVDYTDLQLQSIFDTAAGGNGLISLAHQLIAAKLNVANGADDSAVAAAITAADALIGGLVVPPVGAGSLSPGSTSALVETLKSYNEGATGPGHCE